MLLEIQNTLPQWCSINGQSLDELIIDAQPIKPSGLPGNKHLLKIRSSGLKISVLEFQPGTNLPKACPERHINSDGTFCVGYNAGHNIRDTKSADIWWNYLSEFLNCQDFAAKQKRWPPGKGLSHGQAAIFQVMAERYAKQLDILQEYKDAVEFGQGWLAGPLPKAKDKRTRLLNGRISCPNQCKSKKNRTLLRCECSKPEAVFGLVQSELKRRIEEYEFVRSFRSIDFKCCGTMETCPFKDKG